MYGAAAVSSQQQANKGQKNQTSVMRFEFETPGLAYNIIVIHLSFIYKKVTNIAKKSYLLI